jgi:translation initiation factor 2 subunit 1
MEKKRFPEQDEIVSCVVDRILGTTVFVKIPGYNKEGVIATSEVAPGRIRNIRDYVTVGKKIVCKVLRVDEQTGHIDLSLRRVIKKEREEALTRESRERDAAAMLKIIVKERADAVTEKIKKEYPILSEFLRDIEKIDAASFGLTGKEQEQLIKIKMEKPQRKVSIKAEIKLKSEASDGIVRIKSIFENILKSYNDVKIIYISAPNYSLSIRAADYKEANKKLEEMLKKIEQEAKEKGCKFEVAR